MLIFLMGVLNVIGCAVRIWALYAQMRQLPIALAVGTLRVMRVVAFLHMLVALILLYVLLPNGFFLNA